MSTDGPAPGQGSSVTMKQLLESGVHFGHQSRRWNPKMKQYIYTERNGIYIIDLKKTLKMMREACQYVRDSVAEGKTLMFVGTKKQAKESIAEAATNCGMFYVNNRWLGGMLTNFKTLRKSVLRLLELDRSVQDGTMAAYSKKEQSRLLKHRASLEKNLAGVKMMDRLPDMVFIVDPHKERIAVHEANKCGIPVVAITDTNCDPDPIDWIIPGNDDAIRAIRLISEKMSEASREGQMLRAEASGYGQMPATPQEAKPPAQDLGELQQAAAEARESGEVVDLSARYAQFQAGDPVAAVPPAAAPPAEAPPTAAPPAEARPAEAPSAEAPPAEAPPAEAPPAEAPPAEAPPREAPPQETPVEETSPTPGV